MRICLSKPLILVVLGVVILCNACALAAAQTKAVGTPADPARERAECIKNLETIYKAIQAFKADHLDVPMWLSALVPKYLKDANVLICPVCRRTGAIEKPPLADPKLPCSYLFEFCPVLLGDNYPAEPNRTRREWKRRQMGVIGSAVPLVRCRHHAPTLNLAFDGKIYEAPPLWVRAFTNVTSAASLRPVNLFREKVVRPQFPPISAGATPNQINLGRAFNTALDQNFVSAPKGLQVIDGTSFDLRGVVQLAGRDLPKRFPAEIKSIPMGIKCGKLHFLHALAGWEPKDEGAPVGSYVIRFKGNHARVEIPLVCGSDVGRWDSPADATGAGGPKVAWIGEAAAGTSGKAVLYKTSWSNLAPEMEIESIDIRSNPDGGGLMVLGISAE